MPSKEHGGSSVVSLRLRETLLERPDRDCDWMESHRGEQSSRHHAMRQALTQWLDRQEEQGGMTHPDVLRQHFSAAYTSLRSGQDAVDIHRLRHLLNWPSERFDAVLEQLRAEFQVALHVGEPSDRSEEQRRHSYEVNGQLSLRLAWQD
jgi:hypothetical protein